MFREKRIQTCFLHPLFLLAFLMLLAGCDRLFVSANEIIRGSGSVTTQARPVSDFAGVELAGLGNVIITQGNTESLTVEAEDNLLQYLTSEVNGGRLVLDKPDNVTFENTEPIIFHVTLTDLNEVTISGAGSVSSDSVDTDNLSVILSGTGDITLAGNTNQQWVNLSGAGNYQGDELVSRDTHITIAGTGNATVNTTNTLDATISGTGFVHYVGDPIVTENISGVGGITPAS